MQQISALYLSEPVCGGNVSVGFVFLSVRILTLNPVCTFTCCISCGCCSQVAMTVCARRFRRGTFTERGRKPSSTSSRIPDMPRRNPARGASWWSTPTSMGKTLVKHKRDLKRCVGGGLVYISHRLYGTRRLRYFMSLSIEEGMVSHTL